MRLSDYRQNEPKAGLTRQVMLGSLFLYLTGCNITGINNPLSEPALFQEPAEVMDELTRKPASATAGRQHQAPLH